MKAVFSIAAAIIIAFSGFARGQDAAVWKGLIFDRTTRAEAIAAVGKPSKDRSDTIKALDSPGGKVIGKKEIRVLEFKKIDDWEKVTLDFFNDKLFKAKFWPKNKTLRASDLPTSYNADFIFAQGFAKGVPLSVFEGQKEPIVPRVYPAAYYMVSAKPDRYIFVTVNNGSLGTLWKQLGGEATPQMFPGFVEDIAIISRAGERK